MHIVYYFKQFENNTIFIHCRTVIQGLLSTMSVFAGRHINVFFFKYSIFYLFSFYLSLIVVWSFSHTGAAFYNKVPICHTVIFLF